MIRCRKSLTILLLLCLSFNSLAQYTRAFKGDAVPYDTAMIIHAPEYRKIRFKVSFADQLIKGLQKEISQHSERSAKKDSVILMLSSIIDENAKTITGKNKTINDLNKQIDDAITIASEPLKWYRRRWVPIAASAIGGILLTKTLSK